MTFILLGVAIWLAVAVYAARRNYEAMLTTHRHRFSIYATDSELLGNAFLRGLFWPVALLGLIIWKIIVFLVTGSFRDPT